jgi:hypothetical protein
MNPAPRDQTAPLGLECFNQRLADRCLSIVAGGDGSENLIRLVELGIPGAFFRVYPRFSPPFAQWRGLCPSVVPPQRSICNKLDQTFDI